MNTSATQVALRVLLKLPPRGRAMRLSELVQTSHEVASTRSRKQKTDALATCLGRLEPEERAHGASWLAGELLGGKLGLGPATVHRTAKVGAALEPTLQVSDVARSLEAIRAEHGPGSQTRRRERLETLLLAATAEEQAFLRRLLVGELRQGALLSLLLDALAAAARVPAPAVRRAHMFAGALAPVVEAAFRGGEPALARFDLVLFEPVHPMLAHPADDLEDAYARLEDPYLELKMDGARVQIHKDGAEVRVYSRRLHDVTAALPDVVGTVRKLPVQSCVLDGEVIALGPDERPRSFQTTMRRFGRSRSGSETQAQIPLSLFVFDGLFVDGESIVDRPARERISALEPWLPASVTMPRRWSPSIAQASAFVAEAYARGHEGAMAKSESSTYEAGRRGAQWLKIKQAHTLDLVVLAAEWGSGRRTGFLSNLHLGALDDDGRPVMVGKTFKGLTDDRLRWQTEALQARETERWAYGVRVRPELVVEVAVGGVQRSPQYPGGLSLRFARVRRFRPDKGLGEVDSLRRLGDLAEPRD